MAEPFQPLGVSEIAQINRDTISAFGGLYTEKDSNLHNRGSLEHILEAVIFPIFGQERFPTHIEKIAAIIHTIIRLHIFHDGNKRTALGVLLALAELNSFTFRPSREDEDFMVRIAAERPGVEEVANWLRQRLITKIKKQDTKSGA